MKALALPPQEYLRSVLDYDPDTGFLRWKKRPENHFANSKACRIWNKRFPGTVAGCVKPADGYIHVGLDGVRYQGHRLIFKWMTGRDPLRVLDHRDLVRSNNRWVNLRKASRSQNGTNRPSVRRGKLKGAYERPETGAYAAVLTANRKRMYLGNFATEQEAHAAYCAAAHKHHGDFANVEVAT